jgi:hypothetical protein
VCFIKILSHVVLLAKFGKGKRQSNPITGLGQALRVPGG